MAAIMERALIWPAMLPLVASELRVASSQSRVRIWSRPMFVTSRPAPAGTGQVCFLVHQFFADGAAVPDHVVADAGFGFDMGRGVGIETDGFRGAAVIHGSGMIR